MQKAVTSSSGCVLKRVNPAHFFEGIFAGTYLQDPPRFGVDTAPRPPFTTLSQMPMRQSGKGGDAGSKVILKLNRACWELMTF